MTAAAGDRLVHHAAIIEMNGESYRERSAARRAAKAEPRVMAQLSMTAPRLSVG
jgi:hypothetical protein